MDDIKKPAHYCEGRRYEPRKVAEDWGLINNGYMFNVLKYISRAGRKQYDGMTMDESEIKDLEKAMEYLQFRLEQLKSPIQVVKPAKEDIIWIKDPHNTQTGCMTITEKKDCGNTEK